MEISKITINLKTGEISLETDKGSQVFKKQTISQNKQLSEPNKDKSNLERLREFCKERIKVEPEWREDIIKFGKFYSEKVKTWKGECRIEQLYSSWVKKRK
jgi:hypothetical protein